MKSLFKIERINPDITICRVSIGRFIEKYLPSVPGEGYDKKKNMEFGGGIPDGTIFSADELCRVNSFRTLKKQVEWLSGRFAVKMLVQGFENSREALSAIEVSYKEGGAPFLSRFPDLSISISHSHEYAVAALLSSSSRRIGLDIEKVEEKDPEYIIRVAFTERESRSIDKADHLDFYTRWTAKEAYMKYIGKGFNESLKKVEVIGDAIFHHKRRVEDIEFVTGDFEGRYAFTLIYGR